MKASESPIPALSANSLQALRWPEEKIHDWYNSRPWPVGCNYIPQYAVNQLEMWQEDSFDKEIIDKELGWAASLGFNTIRVFLHHFLWVQDDKGFLERVEAFLATADKYNIKTMFVFFDAVWNPHPVPGKQQAPKNYVHNSGWVQCPGFEILNDVAKHDSLFSYISGVVNHFKEDERIFAWDLFNEPDNMNLASYKDDNYVMHKADLSLHLLNKTVAWVRAINPIQPLTMAPWQHDWSDPAGLTALDNYMFTHADIISFHCYEDSVGMETRILQLKRYNRPLLCTEYMARPFNSTFQSMLPVLKKHRVGAYNWGFVAGKSQTYCAWSSWQEARETAPEIWFHDIFHPNGEPYDKAEIAYLVDFVNNLVQEQDIVLA